MSGGGLNRFAGEPLPPPLRRLVVRRLEGRVKRPRGRKRRRRASLEEMQEMFLPFVYDDALADVKKEVNRRKAEANATRRGPSTKSIATATELATAKVRSMLPVMPT
jgi:hypothetical protein